MSTNNSCDYSPAQYNTQVGGALGTLVNIAPSATSGIPLVSNGAAANPSFTTAVVAGGGTGAVTLTGVLLGNGTSPVTGITPGNYGVLISSAAGVPSWLANGTTGQILTATTAGTPSWQNVAASSISITGDSGGALTGAAFTFTGGSTGLTFAGAGSTETLGGTLVVGNGGTGATTFTSHGVLLGNTTSAITATAAGTTGQVLTGITGSAPTFQAPAASSISITGNSGGALTGNAFTFTGGTTGLTFSGAGTTETLGGTLIVANGGTAANSFNTTGVVISGATSTTALASVTLVDGQLAIGSSVGNPAAATLTAGTGISISNGHNSITISATGTTTLTVTSVNTSPYTVDSVVANDFIAVDSSGGAITIKFPNAPATGRVYYVKDSTGSAATHNITLTTVGGAIFIDGATSVAMNTAYESMAVIFDGTNYEIF